MKRGIQKFVLAGMLIAIPAFVFLATPTTAATESRIVIHGFERGSNLKLTVDGDSLIVNGFLDSDADRQVGCTFTHGQNALLCPLAGVGRVEVNMGPAADTVEVLDPLPVPLTAHLGNGSDRFIGNDESDTCYPEGTINNACDGRGGNDVCISGSPNTKCIGGAGNDVCISKSPSTKCLGDSGNDSCTVGPGSDKCYGGAGNDACKMGSGQDKCYGGAGNDRLYGGTGSDKLYGESGNDRLYGQANPDKLYGGSGRDFCRGKPGVGRSYMCEVGPGR